MPPENTSNNFHKVYIGQREYTIHVLPYKEAKTILQKCIKTASPILVGTVYTDGIPPDIDKVVNYLMEEAEADIILPLLRQSKVTCSCPAIGRAITLDNENNMALLYNAHTIGEYLEIVMEVFKFQFSPFIQSLLDVNGPLASLLGGEKIKQLTGTTES